MENSRISSSHTSSTIGRLKDCFRGSERQKHGHFASWWRNHFLYFSWHRWYQNIQAKVYERNLHSNVWWIRRLHLSIISECNSLKMGKGMGICGFSYDQSPNIFRFCKVLKMEIQTCEIKKNLSCGETRSSKITMVVRWLSDDCQMNVLSLQYWPNFVRMENIVPRKTCKDCTSSK